MKKLLWIVGGFLVVLLVIAITVPLFVNVDQYRPQIESQANQRINGKLTLGKLKLSLWGKFKINAESIRVNVNGFPQALLDTQRFHMEIPLMSVLSGRPKVIAVLDEPKIEVIKELDGKMNVMELLNKPQAAEAVSPPQPGSPPAAESAKVPAILAGATLGVEINKGALHYLDKVSKSEYKVDGLDLEGKNLGLGSTMDIKVRAPLSGKTPSFTFSGPVEAQADITPVLSGSTVKAAKGSFFFDATNLKVDMPGTFKKSEGMPLVLKAKLDGNEKETIVESLDLQFHDFHVFAKGRATMDPVTAKMEFSTEGLKLEKLRDFVPMLAEYALKGSATARASLDLEGALFRINGDLKVNDGSVYPKAYLKAPLQFSAQATFTENSLSIAKAAFSAPDSDILVTGNVRNFLAPTFSLAANGKSFNVDKTLVLPGAPPAAVGKDGKAPPPAPAPAPVDPKKDVNPMAELAKNPILAKAEGTFNAEIGRVVVYGANLEKVSLRSSMKNMKLAVSNASLSTFGGQVKADGNFDLASPGLVFSTKGDVAGISGKEAFRQYFPKFQNTLDGTFNAKWNVSGAAYPSTARIRNLNGSANLLAQNGVLKSVDVQSTINNIMKKVPFLKDKPPLEIDDGFSTMTAAVKFGGGEIKVDPVEVQPRKRGFVMKGRSTIQENLEQESFLDVFDPQGILPRDIQQQGKPAIALRITGPVSDPKPDYEYTVKRLAVNAGTNALKNQAGKLLDKVIGGKGDGAQQNSLKDAADKLKKKFKLPF